MATPTPFRALAAPVDASTGDRRRFAEDSLSHQPLPMPARWVRQDIGGHDNAVSVGSLTGVEMEGDNVWVTGHWFDDAAERGLPRLAEDVAEAKYLAKQGVLGFSVDLDSFTGRPVKVGSDSELTADELDDPELEVEMLVTEGRMRSATLVAIPAFAETNHTIQFEDDEAEGEPDVPADDEPELAAVVAAVSGATDLPIAERDHKWDGAAAASRVFDAYSDADGNVDKKRAARAFLWNDGDGTKRGDYKLPYADIIDGELRIVPAGVSATAGGRGVRAAKGVDTAALEKKVCTLYSKVRDKYSDFPDCPFDAPKKKARAVTAAASPRQFPFESFSAPFVVDRLMPMTYDFERGLAYGHIAPWGVCHVGHKEACVTAPRTGDGHYRDFHVHRVPTEEGTVYAGRITVGGEHAPESPDLDVFAVRRVYDQKTQVAYIRIVEDKFGPFACGPLLIDDPRLVPKAGAAHAVSGDWRETVDGLQLVEVMALSPGLGAQSEPGFPIRVSFRGETQVCLTASLTPAMLVDPVDPAEVFRETANRLVREALDQAQAAGVARAELDAVLLDDAAAQRAELARMIGV